MDVVVYKSLSLWANWKSANEVEPKAGAITDIVQWQKPDGGRMKINTDSTFNQANNTMGLGMVLRDDEGRFFAAKGINMQGTFTVNEAEAVCIREALSSLKELGVEDVDVETDS